MYYYLHELKHYDVRIIGLDLKADVIAHCQNLAEEYGYEKLSFLTGLLEEAGYQVQVLEFIDMEHTPKNILLRAVKSGKQKTSGELTELMEELHVSPTLAALLRTERNTADA